MSELTVFNDIVKHQIEGIMLHDDLADMFDFMALRGYKRMHEYRALSEFANMRSTSRYIINHLNHMPYVDRIINDYEIVPSSWKTSNATRYNVTESDRKSKVKELFTKWVDWERSTKDFYQKKFKELCDMGHIACANKVNEMIKDVDCELKHAERKYLQLSTVSWDLLYISEMQDEIHDYYEKLTEKDIHIKIS